MKLGSQGFFQSCLGAKVLNMGKSNWGNVSGTGGSLAAVRLIQL